MKSKQLVDRIISLTESLNDTTKTLGQLVGRDQVEELRSAVAGAHFQAQTLARKLELGKLPNPAKKDLAYMKRWLGKAKRVGP